LGNITLKKAAAFTIILTIVIVVSVVLIENWTSREMRKFSEDIIQINADLRTVRNTGVTIEGLEGDIDKYLILRSEEARDMAIGSLNLGIDEIAGRKRIDEAFSVSSENLIKYFNELQSRFEDLIESTEDVGQNQKIIGIYNTIEKIKKANDEYFGQMERVMLQLTQRQALILNRLVGLSFGVGGVGALLIIALILAIGVRVINGLKEVELYASIIASGDLNVAISNAGKDEIAELKSAIRVMRDRLRQSRAVVENANTDLEKRVRKRTRDLEKSNQKLTDMEWKARMFLEVMKAESFWFRFYGRAKKITGTNKREFLTGALTELVLSDCNESFASRLGYRSKKDILENLFMFSQLFEKNEDSYELLERILFEEETNIVMSSKSAQGVTQKYRYIVKVVTSEGGVEGIIGLRLAMGKRQKKKK
jgi:methyl-accepting chemotaxis protein